MKKTLAFALTFSMLSTTAYAREPEPEPAPAPVSWLLGFFDEHAVPAPRCAVKGACTAAEQAARDEVKALRLDVARAAVAVAYDDAEPSLFPRSSAGRAKTASLLASIAAHETGLRPRLVRGECRPGECDGGKAVGLMQIHPGEYGIKLVGVRAVVCSKADSVADVGCVTREMLLADTVLTMRVALHMLRTMGLGGYTGEGAFEGETSAVIRGWATSWVAAHKPPTDADVLAED